MGAGNHASYDFSHIGKNIAALRRAAGMTQEMLAFRLGVSSQAVSKWERQLSFPDLSLLPVIAEVFGVSIDTLFLGGQSGEGLLPVDGLPWEDDGQLRVAVFEGRRLRLGEVYACPEGDLVLVIRPGGADSMAVGGDRTPPLTSAALPCAALAGDRTEDTGEDRTPPE